MVSERAHKTATQCREALSQPHWPVSSLITKCVCLAGLRERKRQPDFLSRNHRRTYQQQCLGKNSCSRVGVDRACVSMCRVLSDGERERRRRTTCKAFLYHISCNNWLVGGQLYLTAHLLPYHTNTHLPGPSLEKRRIARVAVSKCHWSKRRL